MCYVCSFNSCGHGAENSLGIGIIHYIHCMVSNNNIDLWRNRKKKCAFQVFDKCHNEDFMLFCWNFCLAFLLLPLLMLYSSMFNILVEVTYEILHFGTFLWPSLRKNVNSDSKRRCWNLGLAFMSLPLLMLYILMWSILVMVTCEIIHFEAL